METNPFDLSKPFEDYLCIHKIIRIIVAVLRIHCGGA